MNNLITGADIVVTGQQAWDISIGSNCKNLAIEFSRHNRVLYVNPPLDRISAFRGKKDVKIQYRLDVIKGLENGLQKINDHLWVYYPDQMIESINWIRHQSIFEWLNKRNNGRFAQSIRSAMAGLGFRDFLLFTDNDIFRSFHLKELLAPKAAIYYSRDYLVGVPYWRKHGLSMEPKLIRNSDLCVANSEYLRDYCVQYNPRSYDVGQGCDTAIFTGNIPRQAPADIRDIPRPRMGYVGALQASRLDLNLIHYIASERPDWHIVLTGPQDEQFMSSLLHDFPNIHFTGAKDLNELPSYIQAFDVCLNPQILNEITAGNYPRKIDEYLAMGKPVVATRTTAMRPFSNYTYLAETKDEFVALMARALVEDSDILQRERRAFAATHTWENNVQQIYMAINEFIGQSDNELTSKDKLIVL